MVNESPTVIIGKLGAAHGIKGYMKVQSFTRPAKNLFSYQPWYIGEGNDWKKITVEEVMTLNQKWVIKLQGCDNRNQAECFNGKSIAIYGDQLPALEDDDYYWQDLIGLTVINQDNQILGTVTTLMETGTHDVLVIRGDNKKERLIPFVMNHAVKEVSKEKKHILVDWQDDDL